MMIGVGAAFDCHTGAMARAPPWWFRSPATHEPGVMHIDRNLIVEV